MALKALDARAPTLFPTFLVVPLLSAQGLSKYKSKPEKAKFSRAVSRGFPATTAQDAVPDLRDGKHRMGGFGPGSEIGTGWKVGLGKLGW